MVAVGIVGIIAAVAIPQYSKFSARGRQSAAKAELTTMYAAERNFRAEAPSYTACLTDIGVNPNVNGQRSYYSYGYLGTAGVPMATCGRNGTSDCYATRWNAGGAVGTSVCPPANSGFAGNMGVNGAARTVADAHTPPGSVAANWQLVNKDWFIIRGAGNITTSALTGATPYDLWNINSNKQLQNVRPGV